MNQLARDDLHYFISDPQIKPFMHEERHDITASDAPRKSPGEFMALEIVAPKNQTIVIKAIAPYVCVRTDIGDPVLESFRYIPAIEANGFFGWQPFVNNQSQFVIEGDINSPTLNAGPLTDKGQRTRFPGFTHVSDNPTSDVFLRKDFSFSIEVAGNKTFSVVTKILDPASVGGIPNTFKVGDNAVAGQKRVDFIGAAVYGVTMPDQLYNEIKDRWSMFTGGN